MTNIPNQPQFTIAELGAKFGAQQAQAFADIITLEKQIDNLTQANDALHERVQVLEAELAELRPPPSPLSDEMQAIVEEGRAVIQGE